MNIEDNSSNSITARMLESPSSCSSSSLPSAVFSSNTQQQQPVSSPSPINDDLKTTTTNYIEIGCKENDEKFSRKIEPNFYIQQQQQQSQNDQREPTAYKNLSPSVKNEIQDDGYETSGGDVLTPNSHSNQNCVVIPKCEIPLQDDPYNFVDDEINHLSQQQYSSTLMSTITNTIAATAALTAAASLQLPPASSLPKKRGRKKKIKEDEDSFATNGSLKPIVQKERKKHDRFNGMPEEEVSKRTLPDHLAPNLDIIIIGINPGLFAAYKGHHYAGPGNHFWKCLYLSGLTQEQMTADEDFKLMDFGIGFTNMVERATKGSADLTRKEIKEGCRILHEKLRQFRPKIAVFNGKLIFEVFSGKKDFSFGRQPELIDGTNSYMWVMPSSSARCAQLPRAADKVPFYAALKKFRDYLNGVINELDESDVVFSDPKYKTCCEIETIVTNTKIDELTELNCVNNTNVGNGGGGGKKKRGRPKKIKSDGNDYVDETIKIQIPRKINLDGDAPKKKRGRPKKIKGDLNYKTNDIDGNKTSNNVPQIRPNFIQSSQQRIDTINSFDDTTTTTTTTTPPTTNDFHDEILTNLNNHQFPQQQYQMHQQQHYQHEQIDHHYHHQQQQHHLHQIHQQQNFHQQHLQFQHQQQQQQFHQHHHHHHHHNEIEQFSHSDLSSEISAAITSEHDSTTTTTIIGQTDFETTETPDCRYSTPEITEQNHQLNDYSSYRNYGTTVATTNQQLIESRDVASKSLSGLESLVDQIPNLTDLEQPTVPIVRNTNLLEFVETEQQQQQQFGNSCIFSEYTNPYQPYQSPSYNGFTGSNLIVPNFNSTSHMSYPNQNSGLFLDPPPIFPQYYTHNNYTQGHPTIHMPSPNYPYGYSHNGFGPTNSPHLKNLKIFERIKPDIKNASF